jgi:hypothetical protein
VANKYYDPLYSQDGGPPRAFECVMESTEPDHRPGKVCGHVCKTAKGMMGHLSIVHAFNVQVTLEELIQREEVKRDGSKGIGTKQGG